MKRNKVKMIVFLVFISVLLVSWAHDGSSSEEKVIKLGQILPLSGSGVLWGDQGVLLGRTAAELFNKAGGITIKGQKYIYEVVSYDSGYHAKGGSEAAYRLVYKDKVDFILSSLGSPVTAASQVVTEPKKIITFTPSWAGFLTDKAKYTFRLDFTPKIMTPGGVVYMKKTFPKVRRVAMIGPNDEGGVTGMENDKQVWLKHGFEVAYFDYYEKDTTEFYPIVTRILATKPDIIQTVSPRPGSHGVLLKAIYEQGYKGIIEGSHDPITDINTSGEFRAEGVYSFTASVFGSAVCPPMANYLDKLCIEKTKEPLCFPAAVSWDGLACLHEALFRAQSLDADDLVRTMKKDNFCFHSTYGVATFGGDKRVQIAGPTLVGQIQNGKFVILETSMSDEVKERLSHCKGPLANYPKPPK